MTEVEKYRLMKMWCGTALCGFDTLHQVKIRVELLNHRGAGDRKMPGSSSVPALVSNSAGTYRDDGIDDVVSIRSGQI